MMTLPVRRRCTSVGHREVEGVVLVVNEAMMNQSTTMNPMTIHTNADPSLEGVETDRASRNEKCLLV
jgi:hypothetical protein